MTIREQLLGEIESSPDFLLEEVLDFLLFAKIRRLKADSITLSRSAVEQPQ